MSQELALRFSGENNEFMNLTDMWRDSGEKENRSPRNWARFEGKEFINHVSNIKNRSDTPLFYSKRGRNRDKKYLFER